MIIILWSSNFEHNSIGLMEGQICLVPRLLARGSLGTRLGTDTIVTELWDMGSIRLVAIALEI